MFFNDRPDNFFRYARIEVVDKPNETGVGMTEKTFTGPLDRQLRDALAYIRNYTISDKVNKLANIAESERAYNYPYATVEEAVSKAIIAGYSTHRSGAYLRIISELIDEGKIAFTNPDNPRDKNQKLYLLQR